METRLVADLIPDPDNPRGPVSASDVEDLVEGIREVGILQPLVVTPSGNVVCGHRRLAAARIAGLASVPVVVRQLTRLERLAVQMQENLLREDLSLTAEARGYERMLAETGGSVAAVARRLGVAATRVSDRLLVLELDEETRERFDRGELPASAIRPLLAFEDLAVRSEVAEDLAERRITARELGQRVRRHGAPTARPAAPSLVSREPRGCERCADLERMHAEELRRVKIAATDAVRKLEAVIRENLGAAYVPPRAPVLDAVSAPVARRFA